MYTMDRDVKRRGRSSAYTENDGHADRLCSPRESILCAACQHMCNMLSHVDPVAKSPRVFNLSLCFVELIGVIFRLVPFFCHLSNQKSRGLLKT